MSKQKQNVITVLEYLLMFCTVLYGSMWAQFTSALSNTFSRIFIVVLAALIVLSFNKITQAAIYKTAAVAAFFVIFLFFTRYNLIRSVLYLIIPFCLGFLYLSTKQTQSEKNRFFLYLSDILVVLSAVSVVLFLFGTCLHFLSPTSAVRVWWAEEERVINTYFHLLYEAQDVTILGHTFTRNCSIFPEAPAFAAYLAVSLAAELFLRGKLSRSRISVLLIAAITSFSAKIILLTVAALLLKLLFWNKKSRPVYIAKAASVILALGFAIFVLIEKSKSHSFHIRLDDFIASFKAFSQNVLFGAGYYNDSAIITHFDYAYRANDGLSMGLAVLLAQGGLWLFSLYILSAVKAVYCSERGNRASLLCFALVFFGMLFITNAPFSMLTIFTICYFLQSGQGNFVESIFEGVKKWHSKA